GARPIGLAGPNRSPAARETAHHAASAAAKPAPLRWKHRAGASRHGGTSRPEASSRCGRTRLDLRLAPCVERVVDRQLGRELRLVVVVDQAKAARDRLEAA